ncbi:putative nuclease of restriction endonuclease-like (RecB) superfamily [Flavobacterium sp. 28A]|uniref:PDDEXK nuclease domain-containing protein n=1 Tax=Flavobacterium sp. 28A TaxID=2735895 RepID=UPI001570CD8B|nr:PDDEXK nuclease domain-containing protein [Flavobacterium sp. 28A]NRT14902.1 putative nuclease of restriction endonuclease-like (RecB) superfamily [Flavobacterium sp. 28A]
MIEPQFSDIITLIKTARYNAFKAVNTELINLYWEIGKYITTRTQNEGWGKATVQQLAQFIQTQEPNLKGFSDKNLWRMKQFYETYNDSPKLAPLVRELSWTNNVLIFGKAKSSEEREFYLNLSKSENYTSRELERQINSSYFERTVLSNQKLSALPRVLPNEIENIFKENYVLEFLNLPELHSEKDLQKQLILQMKQFLLELGKDFLFVGEEFRLQVGNKDYRTDLLFYHRNLQCLVAFELKTTDFEPEHLGKLNFYLEALDRDVKKEHENPSIGILLCKGKDNEVVEYALSRNLSPTMISEYTIKLPNKKLLQDKLHEFYERIEQSKDEE